MWRGGWSFCTRSTSCTWTSNRPTVLLCRALLCSAFIGIVGGGRNSRTAMGAKCFFAAAGALQRCAARKGRPVQGVWKIFNNQLISPWARQTRMMTVSFRAIAVLLTGDLRAKIGDVGLARFMPNDYMSAQAAMGTFAWAVRAGCGLLLGCTCMLPSEIAINF